MSKKELDSPAKHFQDKMKPIMENRLQKEISRLKEEKRLSLQQTHQALLQYTIASPGKQSSNMSKTSATASKKSLKSLQTPRSLKKTTKKTSRMTNEESQATYLR